MECNEYMKLKYVYLHFCRFLKATQNNKVESTGNTNRN